MPFVRASPQAVNASNNWFGNSAEAVVAAVVAADSRSISGAGALAIRPVKSAAIAPPAVGPTSPLFFPPGQSCDPSTDNKAECAALYALDKAWNGLFTRFAIIKEQFATMSLALPLALRRLRRRRPRR